MVRRDPGTTLTEMLVVLAVFSTLMVLILGFYIEGSRVTARQEHSSASYRRVLQVLPEDRDMKGIWAIMGQKVRKEV